MREQRDEPSSEMAMRVVVVNRTWDPAIRDPEALLTRYDTLTGWSEALREAGAARVVVCQGFYRAAQLVRNGVEYFFAPSERPDDTRGVAATLAAADPDVVHVNGLGFPEVLIAVRRRSARATLVGQDHADGLPTGWWARRRSRAGLSQLDGALFTSLGQAVPWRRAGLLSDGCLLCEVPEASSALQPLPRDRAQAIAGLPGRPAVLWVGRLVPHKDPVTVLEGFARALAYLPDAALTLVYHDDTLLPAVRAWLAARPSVARRVHLRGALARDALAAFYSAADLFVLGSRREGSGYALLEALACGALPVVPDIPAFRALTDEGRQGVLWRAGDAASCAAALVVGADRTDDAARAERRRDFAVRLSWPVVGRRALACYEAVRAHRRAAR